LMEFDVTVEFLGHKSQLSSDDQTLIEDAVHIFRNWTAPIPTEANSYQERYLGRPPGDDNSDVTSVGRLDNQGVPRSTHAHPNGHRETPSDRRSLKRSRGEQDLIDLDMAPGAYYSMHRVTVKSDCSVRASSSLHLPSAMRIV
jgi:hypothetical protein